MADGPLIQHSSQIAIEQNTSVEECFKLVKEIRKINNDNTFEILGRLQESDVRGCNQILDQIT